tara:strand:+ start:4082 stop:4831 length:750 start_codon:yes stop_codon:yes gene_type:complete
MAVKQILKALKIKGISPLEKLILVLLADSQNKDGECFPSVSNLSERAGCSRASVFRALDALEDNHGLITRSGGGGGREANTFKLILEGDKKPSKPTNGDHHNCEQRGLNMRPHPSQYETAPVSICDPTRLNLRPHPSQIETPPYITSNITSNRTSNITNGHSTFECVYALYPRKVGKPKALKAIEKAIQRHGSEKVVEGTKRFAAVCDLDRQFIPHPTTFFNQDRFLDDEATWTKAQRKPQSVPNDFDF